MKKLVYLGSISLLLFSCQSTKEFYDDVYDEAYQPTTDINSDAGYEDYIKDGEKGNQVIIEETTPIKQKFFTLISNDDYSQIDRLTNCGCNDRTWGNMYNFDLFYNRPNYAGLNYVNGYNLNRFSNCHCMDQYAYGYLNSWHPYNNCSSIYAGYGWGSNYWGYNPYAYSAYGWEYQAYLYGYYPYYNSGLWNNNNTNNNGSWFNGSENNTTGNHYYGHRGSVSTESSNTTSYEHTIKGGATNPDMGAVDNVTVSQPVLNNNSFTIIKTENNQTTYESSIITNGSGTTTENASYSTNPRSTRPTLTVINNVPASNQFAVTSTTESSGRTVYNSNTSSTTTNPNGTSSTNSSPYSRYANSTTSTTTTTSTSSNNNTYTSRTNGNTNTNSSTNSGSGSNTYSHRTTTSSGSGSTNSGSTNSSGGSGTTTTSRR